MPRTKVSESAFLQRVGAEEILVEINQKGPKRFTELYQLTNGKRVFRTTATLAHRLKELAKLGLIKRCVENIPGQQVTTWYEITDAGKNVLYHLSEIKKIISNSRVQKIAK